MKSDAPASRAALSISSGVDVVARERDVGFQRVGEQERVLEHQAHVVPQLGRPEVADVGAVEEHPSLVHVVETRDEPGDGRLPATGRTDEGDRLPRHDLEVEVAQHRASLAGSRT